MRFYFLTSHLGIRLEKVECIVISDEVTKMPNERENYEGIVKRGLKEEWCDYIRREYEFSMAVCRSLASDFETFMKEARGELMKTEQFATELALTNHMRPNKTIVIPAINAFTVGALMYFFELVTTVMGELLNVNAFDQPGVEEGKRLTYALMARRGFEREREEIRAKMGEEEKESESLVIYME